MVYGDCWSKMSGCIWPIFMQVLLCGCIDGSLLYAEYMHVIGTGVDGQLQELTVSISVVKYRKTLL